jgi:peroxiredoxin
VAAVPGSLLIRRALDGGIARRTPLSSGPAPAFQLEATNGTTVSSADFAGRPTIVHFFASWCDLCRDEIPLLAESRRDHPDLALVGVVVRDDAGAATQAAESAGIDWPLLLDPDDSTARAWGVDSAPVTFFVSADGRIAGRLIGPVNQLNLDRQLDRIIDMRQRAPASR